MATISFKTTIKGGLPVMAEAEFDSGVWYVTGLRWLNRNRRGTYNGRYLSDKLHDAIMNNPAELNRLNHEAELEVYYNGV